MIRAYCINFTYSIKWDSEKTRYSLLTCYTVEFIVRLRPLASASNNILAMKGFIHAGLGNQHIPNIWLEKVRAANSPPQRDWNICR